jgi:trk system potassium uptake protein TrkA
MKRFAVIGAGSFGYYLARSLYENGNEVVVIERNHEKVQAVEAYCTTAIELDATDADRLKGLGLEEMDRVVVSAGSNIRMSILICYHLSELGITSIVAKAEDDIHADILRRIGASETIRPGKDMAARLAKRWTRPNVLDFFPLEEDYNLIQVDPPASFIGKSLQEIELRKRYGVYVIAVKQLVPERFEIIPPADFVVKDSDILLIIGKTQDLDRIKELK